ncbi:hypothetical protein [Caenispirillum bisanense]|uniref:HEPN domain-containing protein n=1 Tax=Caenispirillum bisanense TaxID=414052 RepID=A0A286G2S4_9PROT|nr:hypothetical protein [Caenispirillum bisanense]SOD89821.1 hypothetical protein SAMN05421508_101346 [Caenispirillum bisanense]
MRDIDALLSLARRDLDDARANAPERPWLAAYSLEHAARKMTMAVLAKAGAPHRFGTSIREMAIRLPEDHPWRRDLLALDPLSGARDAYLYPTKAGEVPDHPTAGQVQADAQRLAALLDRATEWCAGEG